MATNNSESKTSSYNDICEKQDQVDSSVNMFLYHHERGEAADASKHALRAFKLMQETGLSMDRDIKLDPPVTENPGPRVAALRRETKSKDLER